MDPVRIRELEELEENVTRAQRVSRRTVEVCATGIPRLDALLPEGGLPRGRAVEWLGPPSCGKTALLRVALRRIHASGEPVAIVDAEETLYAPEWRIFSGGPPFWVVRSPRREAAWCADLLLRSGAFGAVVVNPGDGPRRMPHGIRTPGGEARAFSRSVCVRLQRLAEEAGALLVVLGGLPLAALRLRFRPGQVEPIPCGFFGPFLPPLRPVWVRVSGGRACEVPVLCPLPPDRTLRPITRDRKGPR